KSDRLAPKVLAHIAEGRSYRWIARDLGLSKNTVAGIVARARGNVSPDVTVTT
ncbi:MAG: FixJ family two-component response regulator, partial [Sphingomonas echinoides]